MTKFSKLNETQLVLKYQETNSPEIIGELYRRHHENIVSFCFRIIKQREIAQDLAQDVFIKVSQKLSQLKDAHAFLKWMYQVARNVCMDFLRGKQKIKIYELKEVENFCDEGDGHAEAVRKEEFFVNVINLLENLEPLSKTLLIEKYCGQKTIMELSQDYGLSNSAVKMRLLRSKKRVERMVQKQTAAVA